MSVRAETVRGRPPGSPYQLNYPRVSVPAILAGGARRFGHRVALILVDHQWTFRQLEDAARRFAHGLQALGINPGDVIALVLPNGTAFAVAYYGVLLTGAVCTPINPLLPVQEMAWQWEDADIVNVVQ